MLAQQGCLEHALCEFDKLSKERKKCLCSCCCCSELVRSALYQLSATRTTAQTFFSFLTLCQNLLPLDLPPFCVLYVLMLDYRFISELGPGAKEGLKQIFTKRPSIYSLIHFYKRNNYKFCYKMIIKVKLNTTSSRKL